MERQITKDEEQAYRLCHHEFEGLTIREAAIRMELREHIVRRLLKNVKQKCPQLFPILTKRQYAIYQLYVERGISQSCIAKDFNTTQSNIQATLQRMKKNGVKGLNISGVGDILRYGKSMDAHVKQKF